MRLCQYLRVEHLTATTPQRHLTATGKANSNGPVSACYQLFPGIYAIACGQWPTRSIVCDCKYFAYYLSDDTD